ncbi:protein E6 [Artemisia annua]|uniref:Protein E6 n=1 Tax=Artemisia annua TaxID=35608 RepID=A0A2U1QDH9_ARTAN|nr:protein E6 [Artemisia annua]
MASITFFVFLTLALSLTTIHARQSQFFAKVSNNIPEESQPLNTNQNTNENTNQQDLKFVPQTRETTEGSGYGLSTQDIPNEFSYEPQAYKADNNMYNSQNQEEFMQTNDANMYNTGKQEIGTNGGNMYNNYEKQGMSDTRFLNNGKYYYNGQGFDGARFVETQESGNNMFNNQKQGVNGYNQEMYNSRNQGMGENKYTTTNNDNSYDRYNTNGRGGSNNVNMYNPERQGMSDTRFLENGKYYYDLNLENQNLNSRGVRNGFETYGNNDNSYDRYNTNANGGYQNQEFQVNQYDP